MELFEQLAESILVASQEKRDPELVKILNQEVLPDLKRNDWDRQTDQRRREALRDYLYENPRNAGRLSRRLLAIDFPEAGAGVYWIPPFIRETAEKAAKAKAKAALVEWDGPIGEVVNGLDNYAQKCMIAFIMAPDTLAGYAAEWKMAVPLSMVLDRELKEIDQSRKLREAVDPETLTSCLREIVDRTEKEQSLAAPESTTQIGAAVEDRLARSRYAIRQLAPLRELWHEMRVQEKRLMEILDAEPGAFEKLTPQARTTTARLTINSMDDAGAHLSSAIKAIDSLDGSQHQNRLERAVYAIIDLRSVRAYLEAQAESIRTQFRTPGETREEPNGSKSPFVRARERKLKGLAFSGGGIRSATFNLGILQGLADLGILRRMDYLSTVSGGGYIGSWLAVWCSRVQGGVRAVERRLSPSAHADPAHPELAPIRFLREYSNYLSPETGFFSADTWTMVSTWLRNTILNQLVLILFLGALLLAPLALAPVMTLDPKRLDRTELEISWLLAASVFFLFTGFGYAAVNLRTFGEAWRKKFDPPIRSHIAAHTRPDRRPSGLANWFRNLITRNVHPGLTAQDQVLRRVVLPVIAASFCSSAYIWRKLPPPGSSWSPSLADWSLGFIPLAAITILTGLAGGYIGSYRGNRPWSAALVFRAIAAITISGLLAGAASAGAVLAVANWMSKWDRSWGSWAALTIGPALMLTAIGVTVLLQIGLMGRSLPDDRREWWSRLGAWLMIAAIAWTSVTAISVYGPLLIAIAGAKIAAAGGFAWVLTTTAGLLLGKDAGTNGQGAGSLKQRGKELLAHAAPHIFVAGLLIVLAYGLQLALLRFTYRSVEFHLGAQKVDAGREVFPGGFYTIPAFEHTRRYYWDLVGPLTTFDGWIVTAGLAIVFLSAAYALAWRIDVNEFSMHHFYKNRIVRCYLGASRAQRRRPNRFTGFDPDDDIKLASLRQDDPTNHPLRALNPYTGPYPIVNTALNVTSGERLAWQERKADSFVLTPHFAGFFCNPDPIGYVDAMRNSVAAHAYRPSEFYGCDHGPTIGTAVAISGAAANPNMGYHTSPAVSFLMTVFNVRLGWWFGNPRRDSKFSLSSPRIGLLYLLNELRGATNDQGAFINLSDGGHFENLGIYELVRRRCKYIFACDGEQDSELNFGGLGNAIRKCRVDFGVEVEIVLRRILRDPASSGQPAMHCAVGRIKYPDSSELGTLIYLKSSLTGDEPTDVLEYKSRAGDFPHQSTGDQWFDESQFESYRRLGYHLVETALKPAAAGLDLGTERGFAQFVEKLAQECAPPDRERSLLIRVAGSGGRG